MAENEQLTITTKSLTSRVTGLIYIKTVAATGTSNSFVWKIAEGELLVGIELDQNTDKISDVSEKAEEYVFTILGIELYSG